MQIMLLLHLDGLSHQFHNAQVQKRFRWLGEAHIAQWWSHERKHMQAHIGCPETLSHPGFIHIMQSRWLAVSAKPRLQDTNAPLSTNCNSYHWLRQHGPFSVDLEATQQLLTATTILSSK